MQQYKYLDAILACKKSVAREHLPLEYILTLYMQLINQGSLSPIVVTNMLYGACCIYDHYGSEDDDDTHQAFVASLFLSLGLWHDYRIDDIFSSILDNLCVPYCYRTLSAKALEILIALNGDLLFAPLCGPLDESTPPDEEEAIILALLTIFIAYRYSSFMRVACVRHALWVMLGDANGENRSASDIVDVKETRLMCNVLIRYFGEVKALVDPVKCTPFHSALDKILALRYPLPASSDDDMNEDSSSSTPPPSLDILPDEVYTKCVQKVKQDTHGNCIYVSRRHIIKRFARCEEYRSDAMDDNICEIAREIACLRYMQQFQYKHHTVEVCGLDYSSAYCYVAMPRGGKDMHHFMKEVQRPLTTQQIGNMISQMSWALHLCHASDICHRDVKPNNFIIDECRRIKLIDYGLSEPYFSIHATHHTDVQALAYRAPELLLYDEKYTKAVDIWALGCVFYEFLTSRMLFDYDETVEKQFDILMASHPDAYLCYNATHLLNPLSAPAQSEIIKWDLLDENFRVHIKSCVAYHAKERPDALDLYHYAALYI